MAIRKHSAELRQRGFYYQGHEPSCLQWSRLAEAKPVVDNSSSAQKSIEAQLAWVAYFLLGAMFGRLEEVGTGFSS